jgi:hypothetical protein
VNLGNHRKILVVDSEYGFTGGMNIGARHLLESGSRRATTDLHFRLQGPVGSGYCRCISDGPNEGLAVIERAQRHGSVAAGLPAQAGLRRPQAADAAPPGHMACGILCRKAQAGGAGIDGQYQGHASVSCHPSAAVVCCQVRETGAVECAAMIVVQPRVPARHMDLQQDGKCHHHHFSCRCGSRLRSR